MKDQCFNLHACKHCRKHNHLSNKFSYIKKPTRLKKHYGWMDSWWWSSIAKKISQSYQRISSRVLTHLAVERLSSSQLVPNRGEQHQRVNVMLPVLKSHQSRSNKRAWQASVIGLWFSLNHHLVEDLHLLLDNGLWFPLNLHLVE